MLRMKSSLPLNPPRRYLYLNEKLVMRATFECQSEEQRTAVEFSQRGMYAMNKRPTSDSPLRLAVDLAILHSTELADFIDFRAVIADRPRQSKTPRTHREQITEMRNTRGGEAGIIRKHRPWNTREGIASWLSARE